MPDATYSCGNCGAMITRQAARGTPRKYCSEKCRREAYNADRHGHYERAHYEARPCETCGQDYTPHRKDQRYCSAKCHRHRKQSPRSPEQNQRHYRRQRLRLLAAQLAAWAPPTPYLALPPGPTGKPCRWCSQLFEPRHGQRYCGPKCASLANKAHQHQWSLTHRPPTPQPLNGGPCHECGQSFLARAYTGARYCSDACHQRNQRRRGKKIRSERIKTGVKRERIDLARLAKRDGWRCHICKRKVTRKTWSHDHLIPLSAGGTHTWDNVALAHHRCNTKRNATGAAQLLLIG